MSNGATYLNGKGEIDVANPAVIKAFDDYAALVLKEHVAPPLPATQDANTAFSIFSAGLRSSPRPLYEAAAIDGAKPWTRFWRITLPLLTPSIFFGMVMTFITSFQVFVQAYVLTAGGPGVSTTTVVYYL